MTNVHARWKASCQTGYQDLPRFGPTHRSIEHAIGRIGRPDRSAQGFVQPNGHHYLRTGIYLNGYRVAAMLRPNTWECELTPEAVRLRRNGVNIMTVSVDPEFSD